MQSVCVTSKIDLIMGHDQKLCYVLKDSEFIIALGYNALFEVSIHQFFDYTHSRQSCKVRMVAKLSRIASCRKMHLSTTRYLDIVDTGQER